ncbi:hypothetical protein AN958_09410 [Leucoagaricus sp. SymC.cos]|nr:hypothetical protein AN958_09410 [Leucoagaricus sp. SymC.cos]
MIPVMRKHELTDRLEVKDTSTGRMICERDKGGYRAWAYGLHVLGPQILTRCPASRLGLFTDFQSFNALAFGALLTASLIVYTNHRVHALSLLLRNVPSLA